MIPILKGFPLFDQQFLGEPENLQDLTRNLFGTQDEYNSFLELKRRKPVYDLYAVFQPFNESTQAIFPLLPLLHEILKPGDKILDLWCRTGWTGEFLAAEFPDHQVVSLWENSGGVLGYKGFDFWLGSGKRKNNLDILFHSPDRPLPFQNETFRIVHGLDTLHRYPHNPLIPECLRVTTSDGAIVFPHVHLTNAEPVPYFDRGELQLHGTWYGDYFKKLFHGTRRRAFILSEKSLFDARSGYTLQDESETDHFNATVLIAEERHESRFFERRAKEFSGHANAFVIVNPLYEINFATREVTIAPLSMAGGGEELFYRHPIYEARLKENLPFVLEELDLMILYWATRLKNVSEIANLLQKNVQEIFERLVSLEKTELVQMQNVSRFMARLQKYFCKQEFRDEQTLSALWEKTVRAHSERPFLIWSDDGSVFTYSDSDTIVRMAISFLRSQNIQKGDRVLIDSKFHPEFFFLFWALILQGATAVPVNPEMKQDSYAAILSATAPKILFRDPEVERNVELKGIKTFAFGTHEESPHFSGSFSDVIGNYEPVDHLDAAKEEQPAVILFTSGSTGPPKGVILSHGSLYRSALIMDQSYQWKSEDRFLAAGTYHTMSGLRNPAIAVLHSGASTIVPRKEETNDPLKLFGICLQHDVSLLNATPNFLAFWSRAAQKAKYFENHKVRMLLSTGSSLLDEHRNHFEKLFRLPVYDYYGLTETTGACILQDIETNGTSGIGKPRDCIVKTVNDEGNSLHPGETGELAIYSENLMLGYLGNPGLTASRIRKGWFYTGDQARIDPDGSVHLFGRKDRMMIDKNGENVYPEEIENAISSIDGIHEAFVTQIQDESLIQRIVALVSPNDERVVITLREELARLLPDHHIPYLIVSVAELPRSSAGKISAEGATGLIREKLKVSS